MGVYEPQYTFPSSQPSLSANYGEATSASHIGGVTGEGARGGDKLWQEILQSDFRKDFLRVSRPWGSGGWAPRRPHLLQR